MYNAQRALVFSVLLLLNGSVDAMKRKNDSGNYKPAKYPRKEIFCAFPGCEYTTLSNKSFKKHEKRHKDPHAILCTECYFLGDSPESIVRHNVVVHPKQNELRTIKGFKAAYENQDSWESMQQNIGRIHYINGHILYKGQYFPNAVMANRERSRDLAMTGDANLGTHWQ